MVAKTFDSARKHSLDEIVDTLSRIKGNNVEKYVQVCVKYKQDYRNGQEVNIEGNLRLDGSGWNVHDSDSVMPRECHLVQIIQDPRVEEVKISWEEL